MFAQSSSSLGHRGDRAGTDVRTAQQALKDKGYDPGPIDGVVGDHTRTAVGNYQRDHNMKVTRQLDRKTMVALKKGDAMLPSASPQTVPPATQAAPPSTPQVSAPEAKPQPR